MNRLKSTHLSCWRRNSSYWSNTMQVSCWYLSGWVYACSECPRLAFSYKPSEKLFAPLDIHSNLNAVCLKHARVCCVHAYAHNALQWISNVYIANLCVFFLTFAVLWGIDMKINFQSEILNLHQAILFMLTMGQMIMCNVKGITYSLLTTPQRIITQFCSSPHFCGAF